MADEFVFQTLILFISALFASFMTLIFTLTWLENNTFARKFIRTLTLCVASFILIFLLLFIIDFV